jgi:Tfp pilus assembly protein FimT
MVSIQPLFHHQAITDFMAQDLLQDLSFARMQAMQTQQRVGFCLTNEGKHCTKAGSGWIIFYDNGALNNSSAITEPVITYYQPRSNAPIITWHGGLNKPYLLFTPTGRTLVLGHFTVNHQDSIITLVVNRSGRVILTKPGPTNSA